MRRTGALALGLLTLLALPARIPGATQGLQEKDARITAELEQESPEAATVWAEANVAREKGDHAAAARLYGRVLELAPGFVHAKRRLAGEELKRGQRKRAIALGREALGHDPSIENMVALAGALSHDGEGHEKPGQAEMKEAYRLALRAAHKAPDHFYAQTMLAQLALETGEEAVFKKQAKLLLEIAPDELATHHVAFIHAMAERRLGDAEKALRRARDLGLPDEQSSKMEALLAATRPPGATLGVKAAWAAALWVFGIVALLVAGLVLSGAVLREASSLPGQKSGQAHAGSASLKKAYAVVLWLSCAYYYVSLPLVALVVLLLGGGIVYGFFAVGRIPVKLVLIVVVLVGATLWSMLKGLLARGSDEDPGDRLDLRAEPRLRAMLGDVARKVGTRAVDNVYLTPGTELAVMERGGMGRTLRGRAERCLILGVGVLDGLKIGPFKAVLAHEYGHFSNRDTVGGGFALAVRRSLVTMARSLAENGAAAWYNPAWLFLNGFFRVFLRISQGASRLQEILADRWAAFTYGSKAFEDGLRHVIEQSVRFDVRAGAALQDMAAKGVANLYQHEPASPVTEAEMEKAVREALNHPASPYDSHPSPADRSRWVRALQAKGTAQSPDDANEVWSVFANRSALEEMMTRRVEAMVRAHAAQGALAEA